MAESQRRFSRISLKFPAKVTLGDEKIFTVEKLGNVGVGGCLIAFAEDVALGTPCEIMIPLAENIPIQKIEVSGRVVRCDDGYVAVQFNLIEPASLKHLQNLIRYNADDPDTIDEEIKEHPGLL